MYKRIFKRLFDVIFSVLMLIVASPIILFVIGMLFFTNKGAGVFFLHERPGFKNSLFKVIKFKSMTDECDENGKFLPNEKRLTQVGKFIRKFSLDELPQLINVLKGEMSLIGPRPLPVRYLELYNEEQIRRHDVRPGITGWAQVNGRNRISWTKRFELDVWYVDNLSFWLDVKIVFITIVKIFKRTDIDYSKDKVGGTGFNGNN